MTVLMYLRDLTAPIHSYRLIFQNIKYQFGIYQFVMIGLPVRGLLYT